MRVLLKHNDLYWTGGVNYFERELIMSSEIRKAYEFKSMEDAANNLIYWYNLGVCKGGAWEYVEKYTARDEDFGFTTSDHCTDIVTLWSAGTETIVAPTEAGARQSGRLCDRPKARLRTINQVCSAALQNRHSKMYLLNAQHELIENRDKYPRHEYEYMSEFIQDFLDEIFRKERQKQIWSQFNDSD